MSDKQPQQGFGALSSVLAKNLNEIEDLPNYIAPAPGVYKLMINSCAQKVINDKTVIAVDYTFLEVKSLNDNADEADKAEIEKIQWGKDKMSEVFYFNDPDRIETTLGVLKKKFGPFGPQLGTTNLLEILEKLPNLTVEAQIGRRKDDNDSTKFYPYTRTMMLAA
jgi:hypothetical protein